MQIYDVLIIGAGPAGMSAGIAAGRKGLKTAVLEKKSKPAIKLSITGKGRCNLTNSAGIKEFVDIFTNGKFLYSSFLKFSNTDLLDFFNVLGVGCVLERGGRYFPESQKALDVVSALIRETKRYCEIILNSEVKSISKKSGGLFEVASASGVYTAKNVIIATGGLSYPSTGSTGDGYIFAEKFGHKIIKPLPALVPVILASDFLPELKGLKLKNVEVSIMSCGKNLAKEFGEMEWTVFGADGPVILTLSGMISELAAKGQSLELSVNFKPALSREQLDNRLLRELNLFGSGQIQEMLKTLLPLQAVRLVINYAGLQITQKCSQVNKADREKLLNALVDFRQKIKGTRDIKEAIVTKGGVCVDEVEQKTLQSKLVPGLYFCGEVLDVDAPTGGFNLQAAFSTGFLAGQSLNN